MKYLILCISLVFGLSMQADQSALAGLHNGLLALAQVSSNGGKKVAADKPKAAVPKVPTAQETLRQEHFGTLAKLNFSANMETIQHMIESFIENIENIRDFISKNRVALRSIPPKVSQKDVERHVEALRAMGLLYKQGELQVAIEELNKIADDTLKKRIETVFAYFDEQHKVSDFKGDLERLEIALKLFKAGSSDEAAAFKVLDDDKEKVKPTFDICQDHIKQWSNYTAEQQVSAYNFCNDQMPIWVTKMRKKKDAAQEGSEVRAGYTELLKRLDEVLKKITELFEGPWKGLFALKRQLDEEPQSNQLINEFSKMYRELKAEIHRAETQGLLDAGGAKFLREYVKRTQALKRLEPEPKKPGAKK